MHASARGTGGGHPSVELTLPLPPAVTAPGTGLAPSLPPPSSSSVPAAYPGPHVEGRASAIPALPPRPHTGLGGDGGHDPADAPVGAGPAGERLALLQQSKSSRREMKVAIEAALAAGRKRNGYMVVKEGRFGRPRTFEAFKRRLKAGKGGGREKSVSGTGLVQIVLGPDGRYYLRLSEIQIENNLNVMLELQYLRYGPDGKARAPTSKNLLLYGASLTLDGLLDGALRGWICTPGAVYFQPFLGLDRPEDICTFVLVNPVEEYPSNRAFMEPFIFLAASMKPFEKIRRFHKTTFDTARDSVLDELEHKVAVVERNQVVAPEGKLKTVEALEDFTSRGTTGLRVVRANKAVVQLSEFIKLTELFRLPLLPSQAGAIFKEFDFRKSGVVDASEIGLLLQVTHAALKEGVMMTLPSDIQHIVTFGRAWLNWSTVLSFVRMTGVTVKATPKLWRKQKGLNKGPMPKNLRCVGDDVDVRIVQKAFREVSGHSSARVASGNLMDVWALSTLLPREFTRYGQKYAKHSFFAGVGCEPLPARDRGEGSASADMRAGGAEHDDDDDDDDGDDDGDDDDVGGGGGGVGSDGSAVAPGPPGAAGSATESGMPGRDGRPGSGYKPSLVRAAKKMAAELEPHQRLWYQARELVKFLEQQRAERIREIIARMVKKLRGSKVEGTTAAVVAMESRNLRLEWYFKERQTEAAAEVAAEEAAKYGEDERTYLGQLEDAERARAAAALVQKRAEIELRKLETAEKRAVEGTDVVDFSNRGWKVLPDEVYRGAEAISMLTGAISMDLSQNFLRLLPEQRIDMSAAGGVERTLHRRLNKGDLLYHLISLQKLDLSKNQLMCLPDSFDTLQNLRLLYLQENQLESLPESLGKATALEYLDVSFNLLTTVPESFVVGCKSLQVLNLESNRLSMLPVVSGHTDMGIGAYAKRGGAGMTDLEEAYSKDLGLVTAEVTCWGSLKRLNMENNDIERLPIWVARCPSLEELRLSSNPLSTIPLANNTWPALVDLRVTGCDFGPLGLLYLWRDLGEKVLRESAFDPLYRRTDAFPKLQTITCHKSGLQEIPSVVGVMRSCMCFDFADNTIKSLPDSLGELTCLETLVLRSNLVQELPTSMGRWQALRNLDIADNKLASLPDEIGALTRLQRLCLQRNQLRTLPASFKFMTALTELDLSHNLLDDFTSRLWKWNRLVRLDLSHNRFKSIPFEEPKNFPVNLRVLHLDNNAISALRGPEIRGLTRLHTLNLGCNVLEAVPETLSISLRRLTRLDLSVNCIHSLPVNMGSMFLKRKPLRLLIQRNPLTELQHAGLYMGTGEPHETADWLNTKVQSWLTQRYQVLDATPQVWIPSNFPRVFVPREFVQSVREKIGEDHWGIWMDLFANAEHTRLRVEHGIKAPTLRADGHPNKPGRAASYALAHPWVIPPAPRRRMAALTAAEGDETPDASGGHPEVNLSP